MRSLRSEVSFSVSPKQLWPSGCSPLLFSGRRLLPALHGSLLASISALPHLPCPACLPTAGCLSLACSECLLPDPALLTRMGPSCSGCSVWHVLPSSPAGPTPSRSFMGGIGGQGYQEPLGWRGQGNCSPVPAFTNEPAIFVSGLICLREQLVLLILNHPPPCLPSPDTYLHSLYLHFLSTHGLFLYSPSTSPHPLADPFLSRPPYVPCLQLAFPQPYESGEGD